MYEAQNDLEHARNDLRYKFYNWACFSAQQGAEKALKAVFQKMGAEAWGHSATGLLEELSTRVKVEAELREMCQELDKAYISARYPDALPSGSPSRLYNQNEATRLIEYGERVINFCKGLLPQV